MPEILCEACRNYKRTYDPQISKVCHGHCRAIEYPFLLGIFKEARPGAFTAPTDCKYFQEKKKTA
jgi:hypothetical protein